MIQEDIRVLIVDDDPRVRQGLATMLKLAARNFTPKLEVIGEAQNGSEAIVLAQTLHPDVVLIDLEMPILDGYEATRCIKSAYPSMWVIILSVHAGLEERKLAQAAGADAFITKGSSYQVLLDAILAATTTINRNCSYNGGKNE